MNRRSPLFVGQNAQAHFDTIKTQDLLIEELDTRSRIRRRCYNLKYQMIVSPFRQFITCVVAGFLLNLPFMSSIIILYEKYSANAL
jgi:hypothetical protein